MVKDIETVEKILIENDISGIRRKKNDSELYRHQPIIVEHMTSCCAIQSLIDNRLRIVNGGQKKYEDLQMKTLLSHWLAL